MDKIKELYWKMVEYDAGDPFRIQHFVKVHSFAALIGKEEKLDDKTQEILECAALVHDIGIRLAEEKYGKCSGKLQEQEGPAEAEKMLESLGFGTDVIERVSWLVGHHHTYHAIEGADYQILVEADFLVNYLEENMSEEQIKKSAEKIFQTETGKRLVKTMFYPDKNLCQRLGHRMPFRIWKILLKNRVFIFVSKEKVNGQSMEKVIH